MRNRQTITILFFALVVLSCGDPTGPEKPGVTLRQEVVDARNGGIQGFYFLPPLAPAASYPGIFDPSRSPSVRICALSGGNCGATVAEFSMQSADGRGRIRVSTTDEQYAVEWLTKSESIPVGEYRITVLDGSTALGHADVNLVKKNTDAKHNASSIYSAVLGAAIPIRFRIEQQASSPAARLEIQPSTFLLPGGGTSRALSVKAFDTDGNEVAPGVVTWSSSKPGVITVSTSGIATAVATTGSSQITAQSGGVVSPPALGVVSSVPQGALLLTDENFLPPPASISAFTAAIGDQSENLIVPVDPNAQYQPGWLYKVYVTGVTPTVGQILLSTGNAAVGGRVTAVAPYATGDWEVTLELLKISDLLPGLSVDETIELHASDIEVPASLRSSFNVVRRDDGRIEMTPATFRTFANMRMPQPSVLNFSDSVESFELGPFECETSASASLTPVLGVPSFHVDPDLSLDILYSQGSGLQRFVVHGGIDAGLTVKQTFTGKGEAGIECKVELATVILPIGGPLAMFIGGSVPVGMGFELKGEIALDSVGVDEGVTAGVNASLGFDCTAGCDAVADLNGSANGFMRPVLPTPDAGLKTTLGAEAFAFAKLEIGNAFLKSLRFEAFDAKGGLKQSLDVANRIEQVADPNYSSKFQLSFDVEGETGEDIEKLRNLLSIDVLKVKLESSVGLATSPRLGTFTISPARVRAQNSSDTDQKASFILSIDSVAYFGGYSIDSVELYRVKKSSGGAFTLDSIPGGCTLISAVAGQSTFSCAAALPKSWAGEQTIYAFVKPRIFGVSLPVLFELADDAKASVTVDTASVAVSPDSATVQTGGAQQFTATVTGISSSAVTWSATSGSISSTGLFTAGSSPGTVTVTATSVIDTSKKGTATITVTGETQPPDSSEIVIAPEGVWVSPGEVRSLTASVSGSTTGVTWTATGGSISASGTSAVYTAGLTPGVFEIIATSSSNANIADTARVVIASSAVYIDHIDQMHVQATATVGPPDGMQIPADVDSAAILISPDSLDGFQAAEPASAFLSYPDRPDLGIAGGSGSANAEANANVTVIRDPVTGSVLQISGFVKMSATTSASGTAASEAIASNLPGSILLATDGQVGFTISASCTGTSPTNAIAVVGIRSSNGTIPIPQAHTQCFEGVEGPSVNYSGRWTGTFSLDMYANIVSQGSESKEATVRFTITFTN